MKNELEQLRLGLPTQEIPLYKRFEDLNIQWDKGVWRFQTPDGVVGIDTYSIWNPEHHEEIAKRLAEGDRCALYMMGTFGVGEFFQKGSANFDILDKIKQRDRTQNLVVFANPTDIGEFIDFQRLPADHSHLILPEKRLALYPGPLHVIFPVKVEEIPNPGLLRTDANSTAFFWIPGHTGYEKLADQLKRKAKGLFGGGSLNIHGQEPSYTTDELKNREMRRHAEWLTNIDFVILDEISESLDIGRSHTQVSFMQGVPEIIRVGSISKEKIERHTGYQVEEAEGVKQASSKTPYNEESNQASDVKVELAISKMKRFSQALEMGSLI